MKRLPVLLISSALCLGALALAQGSMGGMDHSSMGGMPEGASASMPGKAVGGMNMGGLNNLSGKAFERAFLSMMVPHHQAALDMARAVLPLSQDATVKTWANQIIKDQTREISQMNTLLKSYGVPEAAMTASMNKGMAGMGDLVKKAKNPDVAFVQGMLPHHASAINMASTALQQATNPTVLALSRDIVTAQAEEMYRFRVWLTKRGL